MLSSGLLLSSSAFASSCFTGVAGFVGLFAAGFSAGLAFVVAAGGFLAAAGLASVAAGLAAVPAGFVVAAGFVVPAGFGVGFAPLAADFADEAFDEVDPG